MNGIAIRRFFCISQRCDFLKSCPKQKGPWNTIEGGIGGFHSLPMSQELWEALYYLSMVSDCPILIEHRVWLSTETAQVQA